MRSLHTTASVHAHFASTSLFRLALPDTLKSCSCLSLVVFTHHLPAPLRSASVTTLHRYYEGSDFLPFSPGRISPIHSPELPTVLLPNTCRSRVTAFSRSLSVTRSRAGPFPVCAHHVWTSPLDGRLVRSTGRIGFLSCGPVVSPPVAPHPVSPRRSYGRLWSMNVQPRGTFTLLFGRALGRTIRRCGGTFSRGEKEDCTARTLNNSHLAWLQITTRNPEAPEFRILTSEF